MRLPCFFAASIVVAFGSSVGCGGGSDGSDEPQPVDGVADAAADAPRDAASAVPPVASPGTCNFTVDGTPYQSAAGDVFTTVTVDANGLTVQCVAIAGTQRFTVNLVATDVTATGTYTNSLAQFSEQPAEGGSATQYRTFTATVVVQALSFESVAGSCSFTGSGTAASKNVAVTFNLPRS